VIAVRPLKEHAEFADAVELQRLIWGFEEVELLPVRLFVTALKVGGQALGAYDGERLVGFCLAIPGIGAGGKSYLHSHMLGVLPQYRDAGVGRRLKLAQRDDALARGIELVEWTFDPLEIKNAYFNLERLGAIVRRFVPNQYGSTTSPLHGGLPTDRCVAEWWLTSPRASGAGPRPAQAFFRSITARIAVPASIDAIKRGNPQQAREIQTRVREEFLKHLSNGLVVIGFERGPETCHYLLGPWDSQ
jgi:predicted GNAT superfamily acetyltransferase